MNVDKAAMTKGFFAVVAGTKVKSNSDEKIISVSHVANVGIRVPRMALTELPKGTLLTSFSHPTRDSELYQVRFNTMIYQLNDNNLEQEGFVPNES